MTDEMGADPVPDYLTSVKANARYALSRIEHYFDILGSLR
ncbi:hypothetical protein K788_0007360 (plasmid) [Paraburkholderia caribensis MBA4]|uniref:Uncharacterized protein n=1 Tax=Paraburkholderia caribensis MBA4 TaxID=1323664 RepID=A0A0P0RRG4_9BURK|nr:hypothetical protein K788_0007360 [Paraburkholderia caribensis MBA4]